MKQKDNTDKKLWTIPLLRISGLILGAGFVILGVFREEAAVVLSYSISVCLDCIGIG